MPRTTATNIKLIIEVDDALAPSLDPFIETAAELVEEHCNDGTQTETRLELIERWLAAHFYCQLDPRLKQEGIGGKIQTTFEGKEDLFLSNSRYGQQAIALDTTGNLAALNETMKSGASSKPLRSAILWCGTKRDVDGREVV